jgi:hypothetical protein
MELPCSIRPEICLTDRVVGSDGVVDFDEVVGSGAWFSYRIQRHSLV